MKKKRNRNTTFSERIEGEKYPCSTNGCKHQAIHPSRMCIICQGRLRKTTRTNRSS